MKTKLIASAIILACALPGAAISQPTDNRNVPAHEHEKDFPWGLLGLLGLGGLFGLRKDRRHHTVTGTTSTRL